MFLFLLFCVSSQAAWTVLQQHYPIQNNHRIDVITFYDAEQFTGFYTQAREFPAQNLYTNLPHILSQTTTYTLQVASMQHMFTRCDILQRHIELMHALTAVNPSPISNDSELDSRYDELYDIYDVPEEDETEQDTEFKSSAGFESGPIDHLMRSHSH